MMPLMIPGSAVGITTFRMVRHCGIPNANDASRSSSGTSLSISSVLRTTTGSMSSTRASDTAKALCGNPSVAIQSANTNSAATIDGTPARTSTMKVVTFAKRPRPYSTR